MDARRNRAVTADHAFLAAAAAIWPLACTPSRHWRHRAPARRIRRAHTPDPIRLPPNITCAGHAPGLQALGAPCSPNEGGLLR